MISAEDKDVNKVQDNINTSLSAVLSKEIVDGILLKEVDLVTGTNVISHKLNRKIEGWIIVRKRATADIWDSQDSSNTRDRTLTLESSADVTVDLWIF